MQESEEITPNHEGDMETEILQNTQNSAEVEDGEISFSNNNSGARNKRRDEEMLDEEEDSEEARSMMKFARFLEKKGFICQVSLECCDTVKTKTKENQKTSKQGRIHLFHYMNWIQAQLFTDQLCQWRKIESVPLLRRIRHLIMRRK